MTADEFRRMALALPGVEERSHMGHPDFRVRGKIFATLGSPDAQWGMVKVAPDEQLALLAAHPDVFVSAKGAWGEQGSTLVRLERADAAVVRETMISACATISEKTSSGAASNAKRPRKMGTKKR
ncbi:MAG: yjbR family protein [Candidatus Eremiobacteraeota bacterium]|nr:yjbR family protein [Candidatus Eremiobacteraeota bacterium]